MFSLVIRLFVELIRCHARLLFMSCDLASLTLCRLKLLTMKSLRWRLKFRSLKWANGAGRHALRRIKIAAKATSSNAGIVGLIGCWCDGKCEKRETRLDRQAHILPPSSQKTFVDGGGSPILSPARPPPRRLIFPVKFGPRA